MDINKEPPKVKILSLRATDDSLEKFGEVISNKTGRKILLALTEKEGYLNEFANKLGITVPTLYNHLKKLEEMKVLKIIEKPISKKTKDHRYFIMNTDFFISLTSLTPEEEQSKLKRIFKDGVKFASIGIAGMIVWFSDLTHFLEESTSTFPVPFGEELQGLHIDPFVPVLIVLLIGLIVERILFGIKKRKKG